jgi:alkaline phosphatase D
MRPALSTLFSIPIILSGAARAADVELIAGPMVGHVTDRSARIWMQLPVAGEVSLTAVDMQRNIPVSGLRIDVVGPSPFICDVPLNNLEPDHAYRLIAQFEGKPLGFAGPPIIVRTAPTPGEEVPLTIAFGSGLYFPAPPANAGVPLAAPRPLPPLGRPAAVPIMRHIVDLHPRAFLFLGNTGYLPAKLDAFPTARRPAYRFIADLHSAVRQLSDLQPLLRTTPCYALFNDRDFGTAGADRTFVFGSESLVAFQRFWPNPNWGTPQHPGCYTSMTFGDVEIFLLDTRTYRDPLPAASRLPAGGGATAPAPARMLGDAQMQWLQQGLKESRAAFKILAAPCILFGDAPDAWNRFPEEYRGFLRFLGDNNVSGLLTVVGNQPAGTMTQYLMTPEGNSSALRYPIFTVGTSTLNDVPREDRPPLTPAPAGRPADLVQSNTFGSLTFGGLREKRFVTLRLHDETGKVRIEQTIFAGQLKNP